MRNFSVSLNWPKASWTTHFRARRKRLHEDEYGQHKQPWQSKKRWRLHLPCDAHECRVIVGRRRTWRPELLLLEQNLEVAKSLLFAGSQVAEMALGVAMLNPASRWHPVD